MRLVLVLLCLAPLALAACGAAERGAVGTSTGEADTTTTPPAEPVPAPDPSQLYEADATVLEQGASGGLPGHGPELCFGAMTASLPPICGGLPVANWDWDAVEGEESASGTTWGSYHVVGTYEDDAFTVTSVGPYETGGDPAGLDAPFRPTCPEPAGGWVDVDPTKAGDEDSGRAAERAARLPGYVASWVRYVGDPTPDEMMELEAEGRLPQVIIHIVVTGDTEGAEAAIREAWGGPLCVLERRGYTERELRQIRAEAEAFIENELGLHREDSWEGEPGYAAEVIVWVDPNGAGQAALDERYGPGMVRLYPALSPVESR